MPPASHTMPPMMASWRSRRTRLTTPCSKGTPMVFELEGNEFEPQPVETGLRADGYTAITTGLDIDDIVAIAGAFQLKSLLLKSQIGDTD